jgi:predicted dehydrogenase
MAGCGLIGRHHFIPGIRNSEHAELIGITASSKEKAEIFASEMQIPNSYPDFHAMIADPEIEAVIIATPNHLHHQQVLDAARSGKHVLCEKPMALDLTQAQQMVEACREGSVTLMIAHHLRFKAVNQKVKEILESSRLGRISTCSVQWSFNCGCPEPDNWHAKRELAGGGQIMNVNSHCIDLLVYLFGRATKVCAVMSSETDCDVEDVSAITIEFKNGVLAVARGSYRETGTQNDLEICGSKQTLVVKGACSTDNSGSILELPAKTETDYGLRLSPYTSEIDHFCQSIRDGAEPVSSGNEVLETMWILMAAYESVATGKHIARA